MKYGKKGVNMRRRQMTAAMLLALPGILLSPGNIQAQVIDLNQLVIPELRIRGESLQTALFAIIQGTGLSHVIPRFGTAQDSVQISSLLLQNVTVADALREVLEPQGLTYRQEGNFLRIIQNIESRVIYFSFLAARFTTGGGVTSGQGGLGGTGGGAAAIGGGAMAGAAGGGMGGALQFEEQLRELLTDNATLRIDVESHTIFVEDLVPNVERLTEYIELIDVPPRQVEIEVRLVEVVRTEDTSTGLDYRLGVSGSPDVESIAAELPGLSAGGFLVDLQGFALGGIYGGNLDLDAAIRALATVSDANVLSRPSTVVLDGHSAVINMTDQIPYTEAIFGQSVTTLSTSFIDVGIRLTVTPTILDSFTVRIQVNVEFSTAPTLTAEGVPVISTRSASAPVMVRDGEIFVMAGLIREEETLTETGIPFLSKIPIIKHLFISTVKRKEKRELLIFIEPRIIHTDQTYKPPFEIPPGSGQ